MSTEPASATGAAFDATAEVGPTSNGTPEQTHHAALLDEARTAVTVAQVKVDKQGAHLAGARQALAAAQAELNTLEG